MKTMTTVTGNMPTECWIFENHTYWYNGMTDTDLPYTDASNECLLKALNNECLLKKVNGISYRRTLRPIPAAVRTFSEVCEYWDSEVFEEMDVSAPLFVAMPNHTWRYCGKNYTGKIVTKETIDAAERLIYLVQSKVEEYENILLEVNRYQYTKEQLGGKPSTVCRTHILPGQSIYEINMNHDSFVIFGIYSPINRGYGSWSAIFDRKQIATDTYIELEVPKHIAGIVIGAEGRNIKGWAEFLKVKYIKVIPV